MKIKFFLVKNEISNYLKDPSILALIVLPIVMSKLVTSAMKSTELDMFLISMWIIFAQLMVGIMLSAPNITQERESKTIDALTCTPVKLSGIISSKVVAIFIMSLFSQILVFIVNIGFTDSLLYSLIPIAIGGLLFTLLGVIIGLKSKNSQSTTAISASVMVSLFLVVSVYDIFSKYVKYVLQFIPSISESLLINSIVENDKILIKELGIISVWLVIALLVVRHIIVNSKEK